MTKPQLLCAVLLLGPCVLAAQAPPTIKEALAARHVDTSSIAALRAALQNQNPSVRSMAAMEMASEGAKEEKGSIVAALEREDNIEARVAIARALLVLNDARGVTELRRICVAKELRIDLRLFAASSLHPPSYECTEAIALTLSTTPPSDPQLLTELQYLIQAESPVSVPPRLVPLLLTCAESALKSDVAPVRKLAAKLTVVYHLSGALPSLREAVTRERDEDVMRNMEKAIALLSNTSN